MSTMERILRLMAEKKASDVYLSANAPALIKINGECVQINNQILPPDAPRNLLSEIVPPDRIEELEETGELNMGVPLSGVGRFRVSAMRQRGSYAVVIRFISQQVFRVVEQAGFIAGRPCGFGRFFDGGGWGSGGSGWCGDTWGRLGSSGSGSWRPGPGVMIKRRRRIMDPGGT